MPRRDCEKAKQRLKAVKARLAEEKKREGARDSVGGGRRCEAS
jgi:hypothetical protein